MENIAWNIESEYPSLESKEFIADLNLIAQKTQEIAALASNPDISKMQKALGLREEAMILLMNVRTYVGCITSVDGTREDAQKISSKILMMRSSLNQAFESLRLWLLQCDEELFQAILKPSSLQSSKFYWAQERTRVDFSLSEKEEKLIQGFEIPGHAAWGALYKKLSSSLKCELKYPNRIDVVGLAHAHSLTRDNDEQTRKVAWKAIQQAWAAHQESAAAILNALAGWRLEDNRRRSQKGREKHFLSDPLFANRINEKTLNAMLDACQRNAASVREAATSMAKLMNKSRLDPWDLLAACPVGEFSEYSFSEAISIIEKSFATADAEMGEFVSMMAKNRWIEGRLLPNKSTGAYCTGFNKSREPRVFMTFRGSASDLSTLAHELGHAYHSWVMRDLSEAELEYPMTLAETASIFSETLVQDELYKSAQSKEEKLGYAWSDAGHALSLLLNIPARFDFEKKFYEQVQSDQASAGELCSLTDKAWTKWYGDALSENDKMFWAHKLHFSMVGLSFYNFPYTFGYLFSLSIYARRVQLGADFGKKYIDILRDTGRMTAEELVKKHLGEDIESPDFWQKAINVVLGKIERFKSLT